jgi:release factor glutamine methyltransferase
LTIAESLRKAAARLSACGVQNCRLDAEVLLGHVLTRDRAWLVVHYPDSLDPGVQRSYEGLLDRRAAREPLQYITGHQEFWGLDFSVTPDVLIPRPETELVVETACAALDGVSRPSVIDLCTGSGCIAVSLARERADATLFATDRSRAALAVARQNAAHHGVADRILFLEGDLLEPLAALGIRGSIDVIAANPPYVKSGELASLQPEVRDFEPEVALIAGQEGTEVSDRIISASPDYLRSGGWLIMEMGVGQGTMLCGLVERTGAYGTIEVLKDLAGIDRVIRAQKI